MTNYSYIYRKNVYGQESAIAYKDSELRDMLEQVLYDMDGQCVYIDEEFETIDDIVDAIRTLSGSNEFDVYPQGMFTAEQARQYGMPALAREIESLESSN